ncbi:beta-lactamase/transpeptidase-like protein [Lophiostoma macrostomum CBS 122681]|uniref:Beta-lactamase/transpeptidase-like protein n=1 Tax=Lophiostoma macrostomum CBS 122681 TaxID=1314788 RepID=A0A6A6SMT2_9PLEO|nr:beta-lactamase/transpeptidase-like protein [Lophiostoma macrostomum CBS 122681]
MAPLRAFLAIILGSSAPVARAYCRPAGPILPPPSLKHSPGKPLLRTPLHDLSFAGDTSYAITAAIGNVEVFKQEHRSPVFRDAGHASLFDTQFRIASVTKLFTVLALLLSPKLSWDAPITRYVDGLSSAYENVTIRALAGHTSGMGFWGWAGDVTRPQFDPASFGLPAVNRTPTNCDFIPGGRKCTKRDIISMLNDPSQTPHSINAGPQYSNIAYNLLGMALEQAYSKRYEDVIGDLILKPLNLTSATFITPTNRTTALLPRPVDAWWAFDFASYNPTGGLWMTPSDLHKFMRSIQEHSLLSPAQTRAWLQPHALLPSPSQVVGTPWEILRPTLKSSGYASDIYTKSGSIPGYAAYGIIVPELNTTVTISVAGTSSSLIAREFLEVLLNKILSYAWKQAEKQAYERYDGTYTQPNSDSSIQITQSGPLTITELRMNGVDVLNASAALRRYRLHDIYPPRAVLFPTDPDTLGTEREVWRYLIDLPDEAELLDDSDSKGFADIHCQDWMNLDKLRYASQPLDVVKFVMKEGRAVAVVLPAWRMTLEREKRKE